MKKLITLTLTFIMAFTLVLSLVPSFYAEGPTDGDMVNVKLYLWSEESEVFTYSMLEYGRPFDFEASNFAEGQRFVSWVVDGVKSDEPAETAFIATSNMKLELIFAPTAEYAAVFVDSNGHVIDVVYVDAETAVVAPENLPDKPGFELATPHWNQALGLIDADTFYQIRYQLDTDTEFTITVDGEPQNYLYNSVVTLSTELSGFTAWLEDGQVVSYDINYTFTALSDRTLVASEDVAYAEAPLVTLLDVSPLRDGYSSFVGQVQLPEGYELIEAGLLLSDDAAPTYDTADTVLKSAAFHPVTNEFLRSISDEHMTDYVRAYAVIDTGEGFETVYSYVTTATEQAPLGTYLIALLGSYQLNPYNMIPEKMKPGANLVNQESIVDDYSSFVNISNITYSGYGEQWQMVIDNMQQTNAFFNVLSVVEGLTSTVVVVFNNYLDSNPPNAYEFEHNEGIYTVNISFSENTLTYVLDYTADIPLFGIQEVQIALTYNIITLEKTGRIQIGDENALKYEVTENGYRFGIKYLGVRRAYFEIEEKLNGDIEGSIFEFLMAGETTISSSAAQFTITDEYVSVVGNKADGIPAFANTINELYEISTGQLLGYEVRESLPLVTFNTLWFNLDNQTGINSIRLTTVDDDPVISVNGNAAKFASMNVGGFTLKAGSRRYDIEFRTQYVYYEDESDNLVKVKIEVPMLFVQQEQLGTLAVNITANNSQITSFNLTVSTTIRDKIISDYATMHSIFISNKDSFTAADVVDYIGEKY